MLAALDASAIFFLPVAVDAAVVYVSSARPHLFWLFPLVASAGSVVGAMTTYALGSKVGDVGLERLIPPRRLKGIRKRLQTKGAAALALLDLIPPPFPFTAFVLASGALEVNQRQFMITLFLARMVRFGAESAVTLRYGRHLLAVMESEGFRAVVIGFIVLAIAGSAVTGYQVYRGTRKTSA